MKRTRAFTLIELLVVVSIIALLVSILLPALGKARQHAQSALCKTNMRTIGQAELMYAAENNGLLAWTRCDRKDNYGFYWAAQIWSMFYGVPLPTMYEYSKYPPLEHPEWLTCPSQKKFGNGYTWNDLRFENPPSYPYWLQNICYSRNAEGLGWYQTGGVQSAQARLDRFKSPASLAANADGWYIHFAGDRRYSDKYLSGGALNPVWNLTLGNPGRVTEYRHDGGMGLNLLLWDGHVEGVRKSIADHFRTIP